MNSVTSLFEQAQLAEAAYANFVDNAGELLTNPLLIEAALKNSNFNNMSFSEFQAAEFVDQWRVIDHIPDTASGFSATVFERLNTDGIPSGQYSLAIRGSATSDGGVDFLASAALIALEGVAQLQLVDLYNFWQRATTTKDASYTAAVLNPDFGTIEFVDSSQLADAKLRLGTGSLGSSNILDPNVTSIEVSGHSLGGHLAMAFTRLFPNINANAIAVNGLGFKTNAVVDSLFLALGGGTDLDQSRVQNVYGLNGPEFAAMDNFVLQQPEKYYGIFIENGGLATWGGHSSSQMTDSLAVYNLLAKVDTNLNDAAGLTKITGLLEAASNTAENSLENTVNALGDLLGYGEAIGLDDRDQLYTRINKILYLAPDTPRDYAGLNIRAFGTTAPDGTFTPFSASQIKTAVENGGISHRYALEHLLPFTITGDDFFYDQHNPNHQLDEDNFSNEYLTDRADKRFEDKASGLVIGRIPPPTGGQYLFGSEVGKLLRQGDNNESIVSKAA